MLEIKEWDSAYNPFNSMKVLCWKEQIEGILSGEFKAPPTVEIDLSNICNHDCIWCNNKRYRKDNPNILNKKILRELIDDLADWGVKAISLTGGGEPMMNPLVADVLGKINQRGMQV